MMVNMLVKIWLYLTKAVITGDVDEVRVQSEEPNLKSLLSSRLFAFLSACFFRGQSHRRDVCFAHPDADAPQRVTPAFSLYSHVTG
jgi:hypothetical protein